MIKTQLIIYWVSVGFYAIAATLFIVGLNFKKDFQKQALIIAIVGFIANSLALGLRWYQTGHFPYYGMYEVYPSYAWGFVFFYLVAQFIKPSLRFLGAILLPLAFLMIGIGVMSSNVIKEIPRTFFTFWLGVHIAFAKLSYGSALIAAALSIIYLFKKKQKLSNNKNIEANWLNKFPSMEKLDDLTYRFVSLAFFMLAIMIISGAIWANKAWGRYWNWDPIETWAFISWLVYGISLHLYRTFRWRGSKMAWITLFALILVVFAFFGIPYIYDTAHEHIKVSMLL